MTERWFDYPSIDPVAVALGPVAIHWYGLMYLAGFAGAWWLGKYRARQSYTPFNEDQIGDLIFWGALGVVLGGRCGYVLFYNFDKFIADPLWLFQVWTGGMSFHGGLLGVMVAMWFYGRHCGVRFFEVTDFVAPLVPIGLGLGRIGNFIGGELWGRTTDVPWAMVFPRDMTGLARHPSQLYQFALEGVALFTLLWLFSRKPRPTMSVFGLFLCAYGVFRFIVEFFREPDAHIGYLAWDWLTMGQLLSLPMVLIGLGFIAVSYRYFNDSNSAKTAPSKQAATGKPRRGKKSKMSKKGSA